MMIPVLMSMAIGRALLMATADVVWEDKATYSAYFVPNETLQDFPRFVLPLGGAERQILAGPPRDHTMFRAVPEPEHECWPETSWLLAVPDRVSIEKLRADTQEILSGWVTKIEVGLGRTGRVNTRLTIAVDTQFKRTWLDLDEIGWRVQFLEPGGELEWEGRRICTEPNKAFLQVSLGDLVLVGGHTTRNSPSFLDREFSGTREGAGFRIAGRSDTVLGEVLRATQAR